jgi:hypothetical protein
MGSRPDVCQVLRVLCRAKSRLVQLVDESVGGKGGIVLVRLMAIKHPPRSRLGPPCGRPARAVLAGQTQWVRHTPGSPIKLPPEGGTL